MPPRVGIRESGEALITGAAASSPFSLLHLSPPRLLRGLSGFLRPRPSTSRPDLFGALPEILCKWRKLYHAPRLTNGVSGRLGAKSERVWTARTVGE